MPVRSQWMRRIKSVEREFKIVRSSLNKTISDLAADPNLILQETRPRDYNLASDQLGATYLIRLYAEFEAGLRDHYASLKPKNPKMEVLVDTLATRYGIPIEVTEDVHKVRNCRNDCVHNAMEKLSCDAVALYRGHLCHYFYCLPLMWESKSKAH